MANWTTLKAAIADVIKTNGNQEITGAVLQNTLNSIVNAIGENATYAGIATPSTNPGAPDGPVFYFANVSGVYSNFNGIELENPGLVVLYNASGTWKSSKLYECLQELGNSDVFPISQLAITNALNGLNSSFIKRLQGTAEDSDALHDPHKWLGSVEDDGGLNALLDGLHGSGEAGKPKAGFFRGDYEGSPFTVENIPMAYDTDTWVQSVRGRFMPMEGAETGLTRSAEAYGILWRECENGVWGRWKPVGGGVGRSADGLTGGEIFNDYENNTVSGDYAHAEGQGCSANGDASHAEGKGTDVEGHYGHAEGLRTIVENDCEHAEGCYNVSNTGTRHSIGIGTSESNRRNALEVMDDGRVYVKGVGGYDGVLDEEADRPLQDVLEEALSASEYAAFDFGVLQKKIGSGRTQGDLDAFGLTEDVWAKIMGAEIMVVRDDAHERTYVVTGSSDYYISFAYGMNEAYEGWEIKSSGDTYTISRHQTQGGGGGESITIE